MCAEHVQQFVEHLQRLRSGEASAIETFVSKYEKFIRRSIRFRLKSSALQSVADSVDVCQSVMGSFLFRLSAGEFTIETEDELRKLLFGITQKKFLSLRRYEFAQKRNRAITNSLANYAELPDQRDDPCLLASLKELQSKAFEEFTEHERLIFKLRRDGQAWSTIAEQLQIDQQVLRKRYSRALERVCGKLGLESDHE